MLAKRFLPIVVLGVACLSFGAQKNADKKLWAKQYAQINNMFIHKDVAAFEALLAPDYYSINKAGKRIDRDAFIKNEIEPIKQASALKSHIRVTSTSVKGDDAEIGYDWNYTVIVPGSKTVGHEVGTDGWHRTGGKWLNTSTTVKSSTEKTIQTKKKKSG